MAATCGDGICEKIELRLRCLNDCVDKNSQPAAIYGMVTDDNLRPIAKETVTVEWTDNEGKSHTTSTRTLTLGEALGSGNENLEGYFIFSQDEINPLEGSDVIIRTEPRQQFMKATYKEDETINLGSIHATGVVPGQESAIIIKYSSIWNFITALVLLASAGAAAYILTRLFKKHKARRIVSEYFYRVKNSKIDDLAIDKIMSAEVITITENEAITNAVNSMVNKMVNSVIVVRGNTPIGIVSEQDMLSKMYLKGNYRELKVKDVMTSPAITALKGYSVMKCMNLMAANNIRKLPVMDGNALAGIVTLTDILKVFNDHSANRLLENAPRPIVQKMFKTNITKIAKDTSIREAIATMLKNRCSSCIIYDYNSAEDASQTQSVPIGIITSRDILEEFYKNPDGVLRLKAINIMKFPIITISPSKEILEANKLMIENNFRRLPVIVHNQVVGIIDQSTILENLYSILANVRQKKDEKGEEANAGRTG